MWVLESRLFLLNIQIKLPVNMIWLMSFAFRWTNYINTLKAPSKSQSDITVVALPNTQPYHVPWPTHTLAHVSVCCGLGPSMLLRSDGKIELSSQCSCPGWLWATQQGYLSIFCPWAPSGRWPASSFVQLVWLSCPSSLFEATRKSWLLRWWDGIEAWSDAEKGWSQRKKAFWIGENEQISI